MTRTRRMSRLAGRFASPLVAGVGRRPSPLQVLVAEQQSELQESNTNWLRDKAAKLHNKCEAAKKAASILCASLTKKMERRQELMTVYANHFSGQPTLTAAALTKVEAAGTALEIALRKKRDGSEVAPKKKSLQNRLQDVQDIREKIVSAKKKLEEKCGQRLITKSAVLEALRVHDEDFAGTDEQMQGVRTLARTFIAAINTDEQE